jgi:hypothetical protein
MPKLDSTTTEYQMVFDENMELKTVPGDRYTVFNISPLIRRMETYNVNEELNCLYDDIQAGLFGEAAKTGKFCSYVESVKQAYPKA